MEAKKRLIFYIHGWASSGLAKKADVLKQYFKEASFYAPTLPVNAELALHLLEQNIVLMKESYDITLVGSSLGGFYSIYLSEKYNLKAVLINPSVEPWVTMKKHIGEHKNFDTSMYSLIPEQVELFKKFNVEKVVNQKNFLLLLQTGDDVLDYKQVAEKISQGNLDIEEGGSHVYDGFDRKLEKIDQFSKGQL